MGNILQYLLALSLVATVASRTTYYDIYGNRCRTKCSKIDTDGDEYSYNFCYTSDDWEYCSPVEGVTRNGLQCRKSHKCKNYGEDYTWCKCYKTIGFIIDTVLNNGIGLPIIAMSVTRIKFYNNNCRCYTTSGTWDYCSIPVQEEDDTGGTVKGKN